MLKVMAWDFSTFGCENIKGGKQQDVFVLFLVIARSQSTVPLSTTHLG